MLSIAALADRRLSPDIDHLDERGRPRHPLVVVDLDQRPVDRHVMGDAAAVAGRLAGRSAVLVGVTTGEITAELDGLVDQMDVVLSAVDQGEDSRVVVGEVEGALRAIGVTVGASPQAALVLTAVLRLTGELPPGLGLQAESFAYSTLLAGPEFARWLAGRQPRSVRPSASDHQTPGPMVRLVRQDDALAITLADPARRNAFGRQMRDELVGALGLLDIDPSIEQMHIQGDGPAFCSGGDLDEFGTTPDPATAHLIRTTQSVAALVHRHRSRITFHLHGACIGAGVELPALAGQVHARPGAFFQLPELSMGLIPGAGGTVSLPHRIGRHRTAYLALTATPLPTPTAHSWHLVDQVSSPDEATAPPG